MFLKISTFLSLFILVSCQPIELISPIEISNTNLDRISINAKSLNINLKYNSIFSDENIESQLNRTPLKILESWIKDNIEFFGNQNKFTINILDASIFKKEINNKDAKKYEEKTINLYEVFFLVEYELYDDDGYLLANTMVESSRSTTSKKYISINETEIIINDLLNRALIDFVNESIKMTNTYMGDYLKN